MRLFVTIPNGRKLTLDAESDALVSDLKAKVFAAGKAEHLLESFET